MPGKTGETAPQREAVAALERFEPITTDDKTKPGRPVIAVQFRPRTLAKVAND